MGRWDDYGGCCRAVAASDHAAVFCPECGHPLFRCAAPGCGGLVTPLGHCPSCVDLRLSLEQGAVLTARIGERLSLPFTLRNNSRARPISIAGVTREAAGAAREPVPIDWERLDAGQTRPFRVDAGPFDRGGLNSLRVTIVAVATLDEVPESYAFSGEVAIDVEGREPTRVFQRINVSHTGTGTMVTANPDLGDPTRDRKRASAIETRMDVPIERAERYEIEHGFRGHQESGVRVPRDAAFRFAGFPENDAPRDGPLLQRPLVRCGRNSRARDDRRDAQPNDLCLRVYDAASGTLDRDASAAISRHACDFLLANDRLYVRSLGEAAVEVSGERLAAGAARVVNDGDSFALPAGSARQVAFGAGFKLSGGLVTEVRFEKTS